jgi:hypothetical protein
VQRRAGTQKLRFTLHCWVPGLAKARPG